jgi:hypothetical protein
MSGRTKTTAVRRSSCALDDLDDGLSNRTAPQGLHCCRAMAHLKDTALDVFNEGSRRGIVPVGPSSNMETDEGHGGPSQKPFDS